MNVLKQGFDPQTGSPFLHAILPDIEAGVTRFFAYFGGVSTIHKILQTGEIVTEALDLQPYRDIIAAVDAIVPQQ